MIFPQVLVELRAMFKSFLRRVMQMEAHPRLGALLRNAAVVFGGNATSSIIALVYLGILTRALSIEQFGLYSLYGSYVEIIARLTGFQTWQGLIHYGAHARERDDKPLLSSLIYFGWLLDVVAGAFGFVLAIAGAMAFPGLFGLPEVEPFTMAVAAAILLFNWASAPTALLRIYDRFMPQAMYQNLVAVLQLACVLVLWISGETRLIIYLAVTSANNIIGQLWLVWYAMKVARGEGIVGLRHASIRTLPDKCPGIWRYVAITNLDGIVRVLRDIDIFIVNALLDVRAVGLYKIARTLTNAMGKLTGPFYQTIYPELARMVAARKTESMILLMRQSSITLGTITGVVWVGFFVCGRLFLELAFGAAYTDAFTVASWCIGAMVIWGFAQPLSPAMMAMRKPGVSLVVHLLSTIFYVGALVVLVTQFGLIGAGVALFSFFLIWTTAMLLTVARQVRRTIEL